MPLFVPQEGERPSGWRPCITWPVRFGVEAMATMEQTLVDRKRQWRNAKNIRHNAAIRSAVWTATHPLRWLRARGEA